MITICTGMVIREKRGRLYTVIERAAARSPHRPAWVCRYRDDGERATWAEYYIALEASRMDPLDFAALNAEVLNDSPMP